MSIFHKKIMQNVFTKKSLNIGILASVMVSLSGCNHYVVRGIQHTYLKGETTAYIDDHVNFPTREIKTSATPQPWEKNEHYNKVALPKELQQHLDTDNTVAFAVIKDGKLIYENYWQGYSATSHTNSFSMAKTLVTLLYLKAVEDGYISSKNAPITEFLPEYANNKYAKNCTLADLSGMTGGYDWNENYYLPFNPTTKAYFGDHLEKQIVSRDFVKECGKFEYSSGQTQLLSIALTRALRKQGLTLSSYLEKSFWKPMGMEKNAYWSLDGSAEIEKAYCCVASNTLDFAKFGQLFLNQGNWNGKQLLSKEHIKFMTTPNKTAFAEGSSIDYGHGLWTDMNSPVPFYAMLGHLGQRVLVLPEENTIIVRFGKKKNVLPQTEGFNLNPDLGLYITHVKKMLDTMPK